MDYKTKYNKEHYKQFKTYLKIEEFDKVKELLKETGMSNADLIRWAMIELLKEPDNNVIKK